MLDKKLLGIVTDLQDANILDLGITQKQVEYLVSKVSKLQTKNQVVIAEGKVKLNSKLYLQIGNVGLSNAVYKYAGKKVKILLEVEDEK